MAKIIKKSEVIAKRPATPPVEIVLGEWEDNMYATHVHNLEVGGYFHGHYFLTLEEAEADFEARVKQWSKCPPLED